MTESVLRSRFARWLLFCLVGTFVVGGAWVARVPVLQEAASLWVVSDPLDHADAIVVLGGGLDVRPFAAADLYKRGLAPRILVSNVKPSPIEKLGVQPRHTDLNRDVLLKLGIPSEAIETFGNDVSNTYEEARALVEWAKAAGAKSMIIPTDIFPTRRVRWLFGRELAMIGARVRVEAVEPLEYRADNWWRHEQGVIGFQNEVAKYLYYRLKY